MTPEHVLERNRERNRRYKQNQRLRPGYLELEKSRRDTKREAYCRRHRKSRHDTWGKVILPGLIHRSRKKGIDCTITSEDLLVPEVCPVFGTPFVFGKSHDPREQGQNPSVDRFDNSKGYIPGNVRVISLRANMLKSNGNLEEMRAIVKYMEGQ
jgi:hypothetical protein